MQSKVSVRGQTVIPVEVRQALGIKPNQHLDWRIENGGASVKPLPDDPLKALLGMFKGRDTVESFLAERNRDRANERKLERRDSLED